MSITYFHHNIKVIIESCISVPTDNYQENCKAYGMEKVTLLKKKCEK